MAKKQVSTTSIFQAHWLRLLCTSVCKIGESIEEKRMGLLIYLRCCEGCPSRSCRQSNSVVVLVGILRVIARQGNPSEIISDNAAQFKLSKSTIDVA